MWRRPKHLVHNCPARTSDSTEPVTEARPARYVVLLADRQLSGTWSVDHGDTVAVAPTLSRCRTRVRQERTPDQHLRNGGVDPIQS